MEAKKINKAMAAIDGYFNLEWDEGCLVKNGEYGRWQGNHSTRINTYPPIYTEDHNAVQRALELAKGKYTDVTVGCSGNFTCDRLAAASGFKVHSNDVSLYSAVLAGIIRKEPFAHTCTNAEIISATLNWDMSHEYAPLIRIIWPLKLNNF